MGEPTRARATWVDLRGIQRLAERAVRDPKVAVEEYWRDRADPVLGRHWALLDHDWHRQRTVTRDGAEHRETDHTFTRYALLPDARVVRAEWSGSDAADGSGAVNPGTWRGQLRSLTARDIRTLDERTTTAVLERGAVRAWGTRPSGEILLPWPGAGIELLLKALAR